MTPSVPPSAKSKRPWYLVVALAITMFFGMASWISGCQTIAEYREPGDSFERQVEQLPSPSDRVAARASHEQYLAVLDVAKRKEFPIGVAEFLLGAAMLALTIRAIAGRAGARTLLVQVTIAQAFLFFVDHFGAADVHSAWIEYQGTLAHLSTPPDPVQRAMVPAGMFTAVASALSIAWFGVRTILSGIAVVALTRQRTREFFDAVAPVSER